LFSGIGVTAVAEFDEEIQALFGGHGRVGARVGLIGLLEAREYPHPFLHTHIVVPGRDWAGALGQILALIQGVDVAAG
jgi:hypothetical protein